jgi:MOSC domain-containing protein YiiM
MTTGSVTQSDSDEGQLDTGLIGAIHSINLSLGGVPKKSINGAQVARSGIVNDAQNDTKHHGGPERAVCIYSLERIRSLQNEGHPIDVGTAGENVTVVGVKWELVVPGTRIRCGNEVELEVASFTKPCKTIKGSFVGGLFKHISQKLHPGWSRVYARVISEGEIRSGDPIRLILAES